MDRLGCMLSFKTVVPVALVGIGLAGCTPRPEPTEPAPYPAHGPTGGAPAQAPRIAHLTGGVGNQVVDSFDQIRAAVARIQGPIDDCYASTAAEGGWRENLMWNLDIAGSGQVVGVRPHYAEYWRGGRIVPGTPSPRLAACMDGALRQLVLPPPVRAGWIRVRFET
jgi:hypothetical protein